MGGKSIPHMTAVLQQLMRLGNSVSAVPQTKLGSPTHRLAQLPVYK